MSYRELVELHMLPRRRLYLVGGGSSTCFEDGELYELVGGKFNKGIRVGRPRRKY